MTVLDTGLAAPVAGLERLEPALEIDGHRIHWVARPDSPEAVASTLRACTEAGLGLLVRGGGSHDGLGHPLRGADLVLATDALRGIETLDLDEGVLRAAAGTPLAELRNALDGSGWELPLDPPGSDNTLGGTLAAAAAGPCFPAPRDAALGLDVVASSGTRSRCGGRVVKNVTGYDLAKLYVGSSGTLAVITDAWIRLRPAPECTALRAVALGPDTEDPALETRTLAAARRSCVRAAVGLDATQAAVWVPGANGATLLLELAGDAAAVDADARWLAQHFELREAPDEALAQARAFPRAHDPEQELVLRVVVLPSQLGTTAGRLRAAGAEVITWPTRGTLFARLNPPATGPVARLIAAASVAARSGRGSWRIEAAPVALRRDQDGCGGIADALPLMRTLKQHFDPTGTLNPGRGPGRA